MTIPARLLRPYVHPSACYMFIEAGGRKRMIEFPEICQRIARGTIEAKAKGHSLDAARISVLRETPAQLTDQQNEAADDRNARKSRSVATVALQSVYEERVGNYTILTLKIVRNGQLVKWPKDGGFSPRRWNPDRVVGSRLGLGL